MNEFSLILFECLFVDGWLDIEQIMTLRQDDYICSKSSNYPISNHNFNKYRSCTSWINTKPSVLHYCMFAYYICNVEMSQIIFCICIITFNVVSRSKSSTSSSSSYYRFLFTSSSYQEDLFLSEVLTTWKLSRRRCIEIYVCTCVCSYNVR